MTKKVKIGDLVIGGGAGIAIQSMTNTLTEDVSGTVGQVLALEAAGCDIVRCAVPNAEAAAALGQIKAAAHIPVVADIHFDYRLALAAIDAGVDKVRINPGNIGDPANVKKVADAANAAGIPIRIGINGGSLEKDILAKYGGVTAEALAESAVRNIELMHGFDFDNLVVSIKSSDVRINTEAHRILAGKTEHPLHIGITEAGTGRAAIVKASAGIGSLLSLGIGDTIRVSLTGDPVQEIFVARDILKSFELLPGQINLISCPTCGRCKVNLSGIAEEVAAAIDKVESERIRQIKNGGSDASKAKPLTVAVMGCAVNGPGEAGEADLGIACGVGNAILFKQGKQIRTIATSEIVATIVNEL
ncbi:MAG: flavodoxin-dependent (E)-4-hydroxy-3-methylbut-2-enyl-diphosphate synthase [Clostridiales Family XIII bacterium]|jgi:(E)-4-hydroxy-3-methylbut-2-enyl-diphosphate synthase|nr:flavodoxin-dependent (E)-4-hydroxy-3-methylbut-2-enyl-diphosphate synthase [Clostridiales Family XIII bacterium]